MRKFFKIFFSVVVILYFSATMFYCFVAGTPEAGKGATNLYNVSDRSVNSFSSVYLWMHSLHYLPQKKLDEKSK